MGRRAGARERDDDPRARRASAALHAARSRSSCRRAGSSTSSRSRCSRRCCPHYVEDSLGHGSIAVGHRGRRVRGRRDRAAAVRGPDRRPVGRRVLIIGGALIVAVSTACYGVVHALWWLVVLRIVDRLRRGRLLRRRGDDDHRPLAGRAPRRGDVATGRSRCTAGLSFGPALGRVLRGTRATTADVWLVSAGLALAAAVIGLFTVEVDRATPIERPRAPAAPRRDRPGHRAVPRAHPARRASRAFMPLYVARQLEHRLGPDLLALRRAHPRRAHLRRARSRPARRARHRRRSR